MISTTTGGDAASLHNCTELSSVTQVLKVVFRNHLRCIREELDLTLREVARAAGYSTKHLDRLELGYFVPKADGLYRLARVLGVPVEELYDAAWMAGHQKPNPVCSNP